MILLWSLLFITLTNTFGYWFHRMIHRPWMGSLYRSHMRHHVALYPPSDFLSDTYRNSGKDNATWSFLLVGLPLLLSPIVLALLGIVGWIATVWLVFLISAVGLMNSFVHDWLHLRNHWTARLPGIKRLVALHYVHHRNTKKNLGICSFVWDRLCGTFEDV